MDKIDQFFEKQLLTSYNTKKLYRMNIQNYFKRTNKDINTYIKNNTHDEIEEDIRTIFLDFKKVERPPLSIRTYFNSIKQFLISNDKTIKDLEIWDTLKHSLKGSEAASDDFIPNQKDIKTVLAHGNACSRAMFLMLASSGRRIEDILALYPEDIDTTHTPTRLNIKKGYDPSKPDKIKLHTKSGSKRVCFISNEATEAYLTWMKERDSYLKTAVKKMKDSKGKTKDPNDKRVFPMSYDNAIYIWRLIVQKAGLYKKDSRTNRMTLHPHCLRKFFRSYLGDADLSEHLMGHAHGLVKLYRNMKIEDLAEKYKRFMPNVTIFETSPDLSGVHEELKDVTDENKRLQSKLEMMDTRMQQMETLKELMEMKLDQEKMKKEIKKNHTRP